MCGKDHGGSARRGFLRKVASEAIPHATYGLQEVLVAGRLERLAQTADMNVHRALFDIYVVAPDFIEQLRADYRRVPDVS
jgi:hypothetical protein